MIGAERKVGRERFVIRFGAVDESLLLALCDLLRFFTESALDILFCIVDDSADLF